LPLRLNFFKAAKITFFLSPKQVGLTVYALLQLTTFDAVSKAQRYSELMRYTQELLASELPFPSLLANFSSQYAFLFHKWWQGFYIVRRHTQTPALYLGPFCGPIACERIEAGKGVCGSAWQQRHTIIVPDVHAFPGHIACSSQSNSEIVVPIFRCHGEVAAVFDVDSALYDDFDTTDKDALESIMQLLGDAWH
jgi:GAF domain-containing protein